MGKVAVHYAKGTTAFILSRENADVERIGYTRLYATVTGLALVLLGLFGLLENAEFDLPRLSSDLLGVYTVNGWSSALHIALGLLALVMARAWSRPYALIAAVVFLGLGLWGVFAPNGELLFSKLPAVRSVNLLNLLLGFGAAACLLASCWDRIRRTVSDRLRRRRTKTSRRERRQRLKRQRRKLGSKGSKTGA